MGLKLWKHNHDRQIAEDCMDIRVVFAPGMLPGVFFYRVVSSLMMFVMLD